MKAARWGWVTWLRQTFAKPSPGVMADWIDEFLGDRPGKGWGWDSFECAAASTKDHEIREILDEARRTGGLLQPWEYKDNEAACLALRHCASQLRDLQARRDARQRGTGVVSE